MDVDTAIEDLKADGSLKIRLHLHNLTNERSGADITLAPLQNITIKTPSIKIEEIPPFSRRKREVDASYTPECRRIDYKIDVDYGKKVQIDKSYQFLSLRKGLSDGWDAKGWIEVNAKPEHFTKDTATAELHGLKFKLSYDDTGLLLLLDVRDDFLAPSDPAKHKGALVDSVELFLDGRKEASIGRRPYDTGVYQIGLYPGNPGTTPPFFHVSQNRQFSIDLTSERTTQGYRLRTRIPFADVSLQSSTPKKIGFDLAVNTADSAGNRIGQYVYAGTPDNWRNASGFRQVWLW